MEDVDLFEYEVTFTPYHMQGQKIASNCNEITFVNLSGIPHDLGVWSPVNLGSTPGYPVLIKGVYILPPPFANFDVNNPLSFQCVPNNILTIKGNLWEMDHTQYDVRFSTLDISNNTNSLIVIRKTYKHPQKIKAFLQALAHD